MLCCAPIVVRTPRSRSLRLSALGLVMLLASSLGLAEEAHAQLTFYSDRAVFEAAFPGLPKEDFEEPNLAQFDSRLCRPPMSQISDDDCFTPGQIESGIEILDEPGPSPESFGIRLAGPQGFGFIGPPSHALYVGALSESLAIRFTGPGVTAAGMDLHAFIQNATCDIDVFGTGGLLGSTTAPCTTLGSFWGVSSSEFITRIVVRAPTGGNFGAEGVDNLCFARIDCPCFDFSDLMELPAFGICRTLGAWAGGYTEYYAWPLFNARVWQNYCWAQSLTGGGQVASPVTPAEFLACRQTILDAAANAGVSCLSY